MDWKNYLDIFCKHFLELEKDDTCVKLIKRHDKNLSANGDFSCPKNKQMWQQVLKMNNDFLQSKAEKIHEISELMLNQVQFTKSHFIFKLNRELFTAKFFNDFSLLNWSLNDKRKCDAIVTNVLGDNEMTNLRLLLSRSCVEKLLQYDYMEHKIKSIVLCGNDRLKDVIKVGPVIDKFTKKQSKDTFLKVYKRFYVTLDSISKEREIPNQSESTRLTNVHTLTSAEIQFQLLNSNIGQQIILDDRKVLSKNSATFVIYNLSRINSILNSSGYQYEHHLKQQDKISELLKDEDEWEIVFVYLSNYLNVIQDTFEFNNDIKVGRICNFLIQLCKTFSRYYNRVHIIKDPDHLKPLQFARLHLISMIKLVLENGLTLLGIPSLEFM